MALNNSGYITISDAYTKGFVGGYNQVFTPTAYSNYLRNCRLENQGICMRDGYRAYTSFGEIGTIIKLKATEKNLYGLVIPKDGGTKVHLYKMLPGGYTDLGELSQTPTSQFSNENYDLVVVGELVIILAEHNHPYWYMEGQGEEIHAWEDRKLPSKDGTLSPDRVFGSTKGAYYAGFIFLAREDIHRAEPTNEVVISHEINNDKNDRWENATDFSARKDADGLIIPSKIICPSAVQNIISTQQNLYIFCQDSVQYVDRSILSEYATNKTLRSLPLAGGNSLINKELCIAAGNYVFFMSKDKHIRTLGYTSGIYDPQIADITDTQFGIQKWIDDNISDKQPYGFAFFNKQDATVEFHLRTREELMENNIVLIRDLQHQQWLIDSGKHFGSMENFAWDWKASNDAPSIPGSIGPTDETSGTTSVVAGGGGVSQKGFYYQTDAKYDSNYNEGDDTIELTPIKFEHNTVNMALGEIAERKLFNGVRLTGAINIYTGNTDKPYDGNTALFEINVFVDGKQICNKKVNRQQIYDTHQRYQIEVGGEYTTDYDPESGSSTTKYRRLLFPIDLVLDQGMVRRKGKRIRVQVKSECPGSDLYLSGLSVRATPIGNFDLSDKF